MSRKLFQKFAAVLLALCLTLGSMPTAALSDALESTPQPTQTAEPITVSSEPTATATEKPVEESEGAKNGDSTGEPTGEPAAQPTDAPENTENPGNAGTDAPENTQNPGENATDAPETTDAPADSAEPTATATVQPTAAATPADGEDVPPAPEATATPDVEQTEVASPSPEVTPTMPAVEDEPLEGEDGIAPISDASQSEENYHPATEYKYFITQTDFSTGKIGGIKNGTISLSQSDSIWDQPYYYRTGETVTLTIVPDENYAVDRDAFKVLCANGGNYGASVALNWISDTQCSFTIQNYSVMVKPAFKDTRVLDELKLQFKYIYPEGASLTEDEKNQNGVGTIAQANLDLKASANGDAYKIYSTHAVPFQNVTAGEITLSNFLGFNKEKYFVPLGTYKLTLAKSEAGEFTLTSSGSRTLKIEKSSEGVYVLSLQLDTVVQQEMQTPTLHFSRLSRKVGDGVYPSEIFALATAMVVEGESQQIVPGTWELKKEGETQDYFEYSPSDSSQYALYFYPDDSVAALYKEAELGNLSISDLIQTETQQIQNLQYSFSWKNDSFMLDVEWTPYWGDLKSFDHQYRIDLYRDGSENPVLTHSTYDYEDHFEIDNYSAGTYTVKITAVYNGNDVEGSTAVAASTFTLVKVTMLENEISVLSGANIQNWLNGKGGYDSYGAWKLTRDGNTRALQANDTFAAGDVVEPSWILQGSALVIYLPCNASDLPDSSLYNDYSFLGGSVTRSFKVNGVEKSITLSQTCSAFSDVLESLGYENPLYDARNWKWNDQIYSGSQLGMTSFPLAGSVVLEQSYAITVDMVGASVQYDAGSGKIEFSSNKTEYFFAGDSIKMYMSPASITSGLGIFTVNGVSKEEALVTDGTAGINTGYTYSFTMPREDLSMQLVFSDLISRKLTIQLYDGDTAISTEKWTATLDGKSIALGTQNNLQLSMDMEHTLHIETGDPELIARYQIPTDLHFAVGADGALYCTDDASLGNFNFWINSETGIIRYELACREYTVKLEENDEKISHFYLSDVAGATEYTYAVGDTVNLSFMRDESGTDSIASLQMKTASGKTQKLKAVFYDASETQTTYTASFTMPAENVTVTVQTCEVDVTLCYEDGRELAYENGAYRPYCGETIYVQTADDAPEFSYRWVYNGSTISTEKTLTIASGYAGADLRLFVSTANTAAVDGEDGWDFACKIAVDEDNKVSFSASGNGFSVDAGTTFSTWMSRPSYSIQFGKYSYTAWMREVNSNTFEAVKDGTVIRKDDMFALGCYIWDRVLYVNQGCTLDMLPPASQYDRYVFNQGASLTINCALWQNNQLKSFTVTVNQSNYLYGLKERIIEAFDSDYQEYNYYIGTTCVDNLAFPLEYTVISIGEDQTRYRLTTPAVEHCTIELGMNGSVLPSTALLRKGDEFDVKIIPDAGYKLKTVSVCQGELVFWQSSDIGGSCFLKLTMPDGDLELNVVVERAEYSISVTNDDSKVTVSCDQPNNKAHYEDTVTMTVTYDPLNVQLTEVGYQLKNTENSYEKLEMDDKKSKAGMAVYTFTMPAGNVDFKVSASDLSKAEFSFTPKLDDQITLNDIREKVYFAITGSGNGLEYAKLKPNRENKVSLPDGKYEIAAVLPADAVYECEPIITVTVTSGELSLVDVKSDKYNANEIVSDSTLNSATFKFPFDQTHYQLTINQSVSRGYVYAVPNSKWVRAGDTVKLYAVPKEGYNTAETDAFEIQTTPDTILNVESMQNHEYHFTMPEAEVYISPQFRKIVTFYVAENGTATKYSMLATEQRTLCLSDWVDAYDTAGRYKDADAQYFWYYFEYGSSTIYKLGSSGWRDTGIAGNGETYICVASAKAEQLHVMADCTLGKHLFGYEVKDCNRYTFEEGVQLSGVEYTVDEGEVQTATLNANCKTIGDVLGAKEGDRWFYADNTEVDLESVMPLSRNDANFYTGQYYVQKSVDGRGGSFKVQVEKNGTLVERSYINAGETVVLTWTEDDAHTLSYVNVTDSMTGSDITVDYDAQNARYSFTMPEGTVTVLMQFRKAVHFQINSQGSFKAAENTGFMDWCIKNGYTNLDELGNGYDTGWVCKAQSGVSTYVYNDMHIQDGGDYQCVWTLDAKGLCIQGSFDVNGMLAYQRWYPYRFAEGVDCTVTVHHNVAGEETEWKISPKKHDLSDFLPGIDDGNWYLWIDETYELLDLTQSNDVPLGEAYYIYHPLYSVSFMGNSVPEGCEVDTSIVNQRYEAYDVVEFYVICAPGYELEDVRVHYPGDDEDTSYSIDCDYDADLGKYMCEFLIRNCDAQIEVDFSEIDYEIFVRGMENGEITGIPSTAHAKETVAFDLTPDSGYGVSLIEVKDAKGNPIQVKNAENGGYYFSMPASDVYVKADFRPAMTANTSFTMTIPASVNLNKTDTVDIKVSNLVDLPAQSGVRVTVSDIQNTGTVYGSIAHADDSIPYELNQTEFNFVKAETQQLKIDLQCTEEQLKQYADGEYSGTLIFNASIAVLESAS